MTAQTMHVAGSRTLSSEQTQEERNAKRSPKAEACFGAIMVVTSLYAIWCVVSFGISYLVG